MRITNILSLNTVCKVQTTANKNEISLILIYPESIVTDYFGVSNVRTIIKTVDIKYVGTNIKGLRNQILGKSPIEIFTNHDFKCDADIVLDNGRIVAHNMIFHTTESSSLHTDAVQFRSVLVKCMCCYEDIEPASITRCDGSTSHPFCNACMKAHFNVLLSEGKISMKCISINPCNGNFIDSSLSSFLDLASLRLYEKTKQRIEINSAISEKTVVCPFCNIEVIDERRQGIKLFYCPNRDCLRLSCSDCMKEYHGQSLCGIQDRLRKEKEESATYEVIKPCPNCNTDIERTTGCNHMKCKCGIVFCYVCGEDITNSIVDHKCPLFPRLIVNYTTEREHVQVEPITPMSRIRPDLRNRPLRQVQSPPTSYRQETQFNILQNTRPYNPFDTQYAMPVQRHANSNLVTNTYTQTSERRQRPVMTLYERYSHYPTI